MTLATGIGSLPGTDIAEATRMVTSLLPDFPHLPELPERGAGAGLTGRGVALLADLGADLQPSGWRLADRPGVDQRRARSLLAQDLDLFEEHLDGFTGPIKIQVAGPWTLAATVEKPRGELMLADHGARRDLGQALAEGIRTHVSEVRRRVSGASRIVVQVDEPALGAVLAAQVPTASGFGRLRRVEPAEASAALAWVTTAICESGAEPWAHSCAADPPLALLRGAGFVGLSVDLGILGAEGHDQLAEALEVGDSVAFGIVGAVDGAGAVSGEYAERVARWLDMLGLDPAQVSDRLVITPTCGLAGASAPWARAALELCAGAAGDLG